MHINISLMFKSKFKALGHSLCYTFRRALRGQLSFTNKNEQTLSQSLTHTRTHTNGSNTLKFFLIILILNFLSYSERHFWGPNTPYIPVTKCNYSSISFKISKIPLIYHFAHIQLHETTEVKSQFFWYIWIILSHKNSIRSNNKYKMSTEWKILEWLYFVNVLKYYFGIFVLSIKYIFKSICTSKYILQISNATIFFFLKRCLDVITDPFRIRGLICLHL